MKRSLLRHCLAASIGLASFFSQADGMPDWSAYQGNASHTGFVDVRVDAIQFAWSKQVSSNGLNPVAAADGRVFVSAVQYFNTQDSFFALDASTGNALWSKNFGSVFSVNPPAYADGKVYLQTGNHSTDTYLRGYDAASGSLVQKTAHQAQWERYYAPTIYGGVAYVNGGYYGGAYAIDLKTSRQLWYSPLTQYDQWTPAVNDKYVLAYTGHSCFGCSNAGLTVMDRATGDPAFFISDRNFDWNGWSMNQAPVLGTHNDVLAINDGRLISFDLTNRSIKWELANNFRGQASVAGGQIFAVANNALNVLDEDTGATQWLWEMPGGGVIEQPVVLTRNLVFLSGGGKTFAVNRQTRQQFWAADVSGAMTLGDDMLYIAGSNGQLWAYNVANVPEPGSLLLMAGGLAMLWSRRRQQRH